MYIPQHFREENRSTLDSIILGNSFGTLVTIHDGELSGTPLPFLLDSNSGAHGVLRGHMARANPQWRCFETGNEVLVVFQGPHGYISPAWYRTTPSVPTWNYIAVHVYGAPRIASQDELMDILEHTVHTYEQVREEPWRLDSLPPEYIEHMARGIVGFEIDISRIEGKLKLSQNRSAEDILSVVAALDRGASPSDKALAEAMRLHSL